LLSVVVPVYNEAAGLPAFQAGLQAAVQQAVGKNYEVIYCDDGSSDDTARLVRRWHQQDSRVRLLRLSRNFGKESALTAGIAAAGGQAVLTIDGDGQHPVELIPKFVSAWQEGAQVVIGVRQGSRSESYFRRLGSRLFYKVFNRLAEQQMLAGSTDYRLIDRAVRQAFLTLKESGRLTRGLIDWLGFERQLIYFEAGPRRAGAPAYSRRQLVRLAGNSFVSLSPKPLYWFGYIGVIITLAAGVLGLAVLIEQVILDDPWNWHFTGTAMLGLLTLFLVGIILISQGILSLYVSHIQNLSKDRPLYVIDYANSAGVDAPYEA
jgi:glycosyltransferase involved in cell wall biosynthesis